MKKIITLILLFIYFNCAYSQSWKWSQTFASTGGINSLITSVFNDKFGNTYAVGKFNKNIILLKEHNGIGVFIIKIDKSGRIVWEKVYNSTPVQYPTISALGDSTGNFYVFGSCDQEMISGNGDIIKKGTFLIKYNSNGEIKINNKIIASEETIFISGKGKYITCLLKNFGSIQYGTTTITDKGNVVLQTDTTGTLVWHSILPESLHAKACATHIDGEVVITGEFQDSVTYQNTKIKSQGNKDAFIINFSSLGKFQWLRSYGQQGIDQGLGITFDSRKNIFVTGDKSLTAFNIPSSNNATFLAQLNSAGDITWSKETGIASQFFPFNRSIVVDDEENIYLNGEYKDDLNITWLGSGINLKSSKGIDTYTGFLPYSQGTEWGLSINGAGDQKSTAMSVDINKNITLAGIYSDTITIGSMKTSGKGIFLSKTFTNVSPVIIDHEKKSALTNTLYELPIKCIDNDSDSLFAEITGLPDGFVLERLDSKNFKISGIVNSTQVGSYNLIFRVNDLYSTVQNTFTLTIVNSVSALPIEIIYSSIPLTGGILRNNAPLVYRFNKPVNIASLVYKLDTETGIIWNQNHTEFSVLLPKLENLKYYSGSIAISDNNGNTLTEQIGFNTDFEVLSVLENENDIIVAEILFDLHGKIISTNREFLNEGVYINRIQFQNGRELTKKLLISK